MKIDHKESVKDFGDQFLTDKDIGTFSTACKAHINAKSNGRLS